MLKTVAREIKGTVTNRCSTGNRTCLRGRAGGTREGWPEKKQGQQTDE